MQRHESFGMMVLEWLLTGASFLIVSKVLPGIKIKSYTAALGMAVVAGFFNAIAWHLFAPISYTFAVLTLGVGALVINGLVFVLAGKVVPGVEISGCFTAAIASLGVAFVNGVMHFFLGGLAP